MLASTPSIGSWLVVALLFLAGCNRLVAGIRNQNGRDARDAGGAGAPTQDRPLRSTDPADSRRCAARHKDPPRSPIACPYNPDPPAQ